MISTATFKYCRSQLLRAGTTVYRLLRGWPTVWVLFTVALGESESHALFISFRLAVSSLEVSSPYNLLIGHSRPELKRTTAHDDTRRLPYGFNCGLMLRELETEGGQTGIKSESYQGVL